MYHISVASANDDYMLVMLSADEADDANDENGEQPCRKTNVVVVEMRSPTSFFQDNLVKFVEPYLRKHKESQST